MTVHISFNVVFLKLFGIAKADEWMIVQILGLFFLNSSHDLLCN